MLMHELIVAVAAVDRPPHFHTLAVAPSKEFTYATPPVVRIRMHRVRIVGHGAQEAFT